MAVLKEGVVGGAMNLYFIYKFLRILTTPFASTDAFKLGIIDEKGKILIKKSKLKSIEQKEAYTMFDRLVWKLKRLMEKIPFGKTRIASYAAALWLIKEENNFKGTDKELQESFLSFLETDWKNEALILKENYEGDMDKKTYSNLKDGIDIKKASMKDVIKDFQSSDAPQFKGKSDKKKKEMAIAAKLSKEGIELDEVSKLPPHLAKFFDKKGNLKPEVAARVAKGREKLNWKDVTPKGYGPKDEVYEIGTEEYKNHAKAVTPGQGAELDEKWEVGVVYHQEYKGGDRTYFRADSVQKNTRWKGMSVDEIGGKQKKPKNNTADEKVQGWEMTPKNEIPKGLKEEVDEKKVPKIKFKLKQFKHMKHKKASSKKSKGDDGGFAFGISRKGGSGAGSGYGKRGGMMFNSEEEVDEASLGSMLSKKAKKLGKASSGYELYHKDFSSAMQHAYDHAKKKGHIVDKKEIDDKVATGPKKPSKGKTNRYELKAGKRTVMIQVANLDNKRYELNMYIEGVDLGEVESKYDKEIAAFKKKGGKVKKLKPGKKFKSLFKQKGPKKPPRSEEIEEARRMPGNVKDYIKFVKGQGPNPEAVFDVTSVNKWGAEIKKGIKAGWISVEPSALGGEYNVSIMIKLTLEKENDWPHKILHNASFGMIRVDVDGGMEMFASGHKVKNMRKTKVKSARDVVSK
ncbi:uncharacterized protein METZ01_LOCUS98029, partial [marine metagenome]